MKTKQFTLIKYAKGQEALSSPGNIWRLEEVDLREPQDGEVLIKNKWFSNDPAQRGWIDAEQDPLRLYTPLVPLSTPMRSYVISEVVESRSASLKHGDLVFSVSGWTEFEVKKAELCQKLSIPEEFSPTIAMGILGGPGLAAWFGLNDAIKLSGKEKTLVVSGAAGAVGSVVVQLAKHHFSISNVIAIVGSEEKMKWVKELGADVALNYKSLSFKNDLISFTPDFVDVYFDNVGGWILDLMLTRMGVRSKIAACGSISEYHSASSEKTGITNLGEVVPMKIMIQGFIVSEYFSQFPSARQELLRLIGEGKIKVGDGQETVIKSKFEKVPEVWKGLFEGKNKGKLLTELTS